MRLLASFLLLSSLASIPGLAHAGDLAGDDRDALTACLSGEYERGITILTKLFVKTKDPTYLYNQGRCYEQNRRYDDAIGRFQEYLRAGKRLTKAERADAQAHIADCRALRPAPRRLPPRALPWPRQPSRRQPLPQPGRRRHPRWRSLRRLNSH